MRRKKYRKKGVRKQERTRKTEESPDWGDEKTSSKEI